MLTRPDLPDAQIFACLRTSYNLQATTLTFLPLGADVDSAVFRAATNDGAAYLVKLRRTRFLEASAAVPRFLADRGVTEVIPPLPSQTGHLWTALDPYRLVVYPFVAGGDAYATPVSDKQRRKLGAALRTLHDSDYPAEVSAGVPNESFSSRRRVALTSYLSRSGPRVAGDTPTQELSVFLRAKRAEIQALVAEADRLAKALAVSAGRFVLCHGDIHGWNMHLSADGSLFIVDWDELIFAPKERDLMFVGGGLGGRGHTTAEEERLFYEGYGPTRIDYSALAYYRFERIVDDIAAYCAQIYESSGDDADRKTAVANVRSNFAAGGTIAHAYRAASAARGI